MAITSVYDFLKNNTANMQIRIGSTIGEADKIIGSRVCLVGNKSKGFIYYNQGIRIGYAGNKINEIGIDLFENKNSYNLHNEFGSKVSIINSRKKIHQVLYGLYEAKIRFKGINVKSAQSYLYFLTEGSVALTFDLYDGCLIKMTYTGALRFNDIETDM